MPAVVLSGLFELLKIGRRQRAHRSGGGALIIATVTAFVVGYGSIAWLLRWLAHHSTILFVVYRVVLGVLVLALTASGTIH